MKKYLLVAAALVLATSSVYAQERKGIKSTQLTVKPVTGVPDKELVLLSIEVEPGGASGLHTHPGDEHGTVIEGELMVKVGNGDYVPVKAGQTFYAPPNTPMGVMNKGKTTVKVINALIVEKGKPYSTPVQSPDHK